MTLLQGVVLVVLAVLSLRGVRSAYVAFIVAVLLYFPISVDFRLNPRACQLDVDLWLARAALRDYQQIALAGVFFLMSYAQVRPGTGSSFARAGFSTLMMGALIELVEGVTGKSSCRLRDMVPEVAGALIAAGVVVLWTFARNAIAAMRR